MSAAPEGGWSCPSNAHKWHFFVDGSLASLCRRWGVFYTPEPGGDDDVTIDKCVACARARAKQLAGGAP